MTKGIRLVCAVSVIPDGAVRAHDHHAVNNDCCHEPPGEIIEQEEKEEWKQA